MEVSPKSERLLQLQPLVVLLSETPTSLQRRRLHVLLRLLPLRSSRVFWLLRQRHGSALKILRCRALLLLLLLSKYLLLVSLL